MNFKKYKLLIVGGGVLLVLIIVAVVMLLKFRGQYLDSKEKLDRAASAVKNLNNSPIYPSQENIEKFAKKKEELEKYLAEFQEQLRTDQIEPVQVSRDDYIDYMRGIIDSIYTRNPKVKVASAVAQEPQLDAFGNLIVPTNAVNTAHRVLVPDRFDFSFPAYFDGILPENDQIERLTIQLQTVKRICELLYEAEIDALIRVGRVEADNPDAKNLSGEGASLSEEDYVRASRGGGGPEEEKTDQDKPFSKLWSSETIEVEFSAYEDAVWRAVDLLSQDNAAIEIVSLEFQNEHASLQPQFAAESTGTRGGGRSRLRKPAGRDPYARRQTTSEAPAEGGDPNLLERRVGAGNDLITVRLKLSVYRFKAAGERGDGEGAPENAP